MEGVDHNSRSGPRKLYDVSCGVNEFTRVILWNYSVPNNFIRKYTLRSSHPSRLQCRSVQRNGGKKFHVDHVAKLGSNENPFGPSPRVLKAIAATAADSGLYPTPPAKCSASRWRGR